MSQSVFQDGKIFIGKSVKPEYLDLKLANRHGLITGATGTGKTVTLQVLAEGFSDAGVPVFAADIKGDLSGIGAVGEAKDFIVKRAAEVGLGGGYQNKAYPCVAWDVFGESGHPVRATVQDMGPLLLSRLLELNEVQEGVLNIAFRVAADEKLPLINLDDLRDDDHQRGAALQGDRGQVRQRRHHLGRRHPAPPAGARGAGRQAVLRRAGARHRRLPAHGARTAAASSICSPPTS